MTKYAGLTYDEICNKAYIENDVELLAIIEVFREHRGDYDDGYDAGYSDGKDESSSDSYNEGYEDGRTDAEDDYSLFAKRIFNNAWDDCQGIEVICPHCEHEFPIDKVEY
jgi:hypothetical protein